jgi:O-antigen/teichoic acid export membrane protein
LARFYNIPLLATLIRVASVGIFVNSFSIVPNALLIKQLRFDTLGKNAVAANVLSGLLGTGMALSGFGVWSLVAQQLGAGLLTTLLLWATSHWRPTANFGWPALRRFLRFGVSFLSLNLLDAFVENLYYAILGRLVPAAGVGLYSRAKQVQQFPSVNVYYVMSRPSLSIFSSLQGDLDKLRACFRSTVSILAAVVVPIMGALAASAKPLVLSLLTAKWLGIVPLLQVLCVAGALYPLQRIVLNMLIATGRTEMAIRLELVRNAALVVSVLLTAHFGIMAIVVGQVVACAIGYLYGLRLSGLVTVHG